MSKSTDPQRQLMDRSSADRGVLLGVSELFGRKWNTLILYRLYRDGNMGFNDLRRSISGISSKMLSQSLDALTDEYGLVERTEVSDGPLRVEYALSPAGEELEPILLALHDWGAEHLPAAVTESHE